MDEILSLVYVNGEFARTKAHAHYNKRRRGWNRTNFIRKFHAFQKHCF